MNGPRIQCFVRQAILRPIAEGPWWIILVPIAVMALAAFIDQLPSRSLILYWMRVVGLSLAGLMIATAIGMTVWAIYRHFSLAWRECGRNHPPSS